MLIPKIAVISHYCRVPSHQRRFFSTATDSKVKESPEVVRQRESRKKEERLELLRQATQHLPSFKETLKSKCADFFPLRAETEATGGIKTLQVNIGKKCNLVCRHCHVESGPTRTENMEKPTVDRLIHILRNSKRVDTVDITGGAPEMNPHFKYFVTESRKLGKKVLDRCNLTIFYEEGFKDLPQFLADQQVQVIASLPCYTLENVEKQRGKGVFDQSIQALQWLNKLGYGKKPELELNLVYNPGGAVLPGPQQGLENDYKAQLAQYGVTFNHLFTITNMPIKRYLNQIVSTYLTRYADDLYRWGEYQKYMELLVNSFNAKTVPGLMCRNLISVSWDGKLFDCDFNQALEMEVMDKRKTIWDIEAVEDMEARPIATGIHCYGCTAGAGSSCSGTLAQ